MCDALAVLLPHGTLFAKNSDRPLGEAQVVERYPRRAGGGTVRTQYLEIPDEGAFALLGSRPEWLWGLEHGVNEHRVAIGNERVWTVDNPNRAEPALIGMDLVRLGLERASTAREALDVMTGLLEAHGQGGAAEAPGGEAYYSSFLVADPAAAWILETSGRRWAARAVEHGAAVSNRIALAEFDEFRHPKAPTGHADVRLAVTGACAASGVDATPGRVAATLRDHGGVEFPPPEADAVTGDGVTVCMHIRGYQATAASMICELPAAPAASVRTWAALGSPCVSVYVPVGAAGTPALADAASWRRFDALRSRVEADPPFLAEVRAVLDQVEKSLWDAHDADPADVWSAVDDALTLLEGR